MGVISEQENSPMFDFNKITFIPEDKSMWGHNFNDEKSVGSRWDFTVVLKPLFTDYNPNNEDDYNERVLTFEDEFIKNARGMGFEVISPIQHEKVKNYRVKFEWASYLRVREI